MSEASQRIYFSQREGCLADALGLASDGRAQLREQAALDFNDLFLGVENFRFVFLQFGRGKSLCSDQSLFALIVRGNQVQIGLRYFKVVAKYGVEFDLERGNFCALSFTLFDL